MPRKKNEENATLSPLEQDVLTVLYTQGELYGLEIKQALDEALKIWEREIGFSTLYPTLHRLEKKNMVEYRWGDEESGGARRKYYSINSRGRELLEAINEYRDRLGQRAIKSPDTSATVKVVHLAAIAFTVGHLVPF